MESSSDKALDWINMARVTLMARHRTLQLTKGPRKKIQDDIVNIQAALDLLREASARIRYSNDASDEAQHGLPF